ncbi:MAG: hypothetical protein OEM59_22920, partial [Rhodospirillales bacterium]|nr:hypothetical protein [Rhodospirillales bacterium]
GELLKRSGGALARPLGRGTGRAQPRLGPAHSLPDLFGRKAVAAHDQDHDRIGQGLGEARFDTRLGP